MRCVRTELSLCILLVRPTASRVRPLSDASSNARFDGFALSSSPRSTADRRSRPLRCRSLYPYAKQNTMESAMYYLYQLYYVLCGLLQPMASFGSRVRRRPLDDRGEIRLVRWVPTSDLESKPAIVAIPFDSASRCRRYRVRSADAFSFEVWTILWPIDALYCDPSSICAFAGL